MAASIWQIHSVQFVVTALSVTAKELAYSPLQLIQIYFDTATYDKIDRYAALHRMAQDCTTLN